MINYEPFGSLEVIEVVLEVALEVLDSKQEDYDIVNIYI